MKTAVLAALFSTATISAAEAHVHLLNPQARQTDPQGDPQKTMHCGSTTLLRDPARVTTLLPGATITVMWAETINHPGHYRIAFQPNGDTFSLPPEGPGADKYPTVDDTGKTDATTGTMILKDQIPDGTSQIDITLPNMECSNCTLQFIQVMTNNPPYDVFTALTNNDLYFNCGDLVLAANAPDAGVFVGPDASVDPGGTGPNRGAESGGCSAGGGSSGWLAAFAIAGVVIRRRRRRAER